MSRGEPLKLLPRFAGRPVRSVNRHKTTKRTFLLPPLDGEGGRGGHQAGISYGSAAGVASGIGSAPPSASRENLSKVESLVAEALPGAV